MEPTDELGSRLVQLAPDGILVSRNDRLVFVNPAAARLFGASSPERLLGTSPASLFHPDYEPALRDSIERTLEDRTVSLVEAVARRLDGTTLDVEVALASVDPPTDAVQLAVRDVTARRRAEVALRESEERLTLAFAGAQEGVWDWNLQTGAVVYSPRWKQMLGYADEEIEPHVAAWERLLHPDDGSRADRTERQPGTWRARPTKASSGCATRTAITFTCSRAASRCASETDGPVVRIVGTHLDITERKRAEAALRESEERLTLAFAGAQEGVWDWNLETGAVVYSPRWKQMLGYADDEIEPHVSAWERLVHPGRPAARRQAERERRARRRDLRRGVPAAPQGRPLRPRAVARISGSPRAAAGGPVDPHRAAPTSILTERGSARGMPRARRAHRAARRGSSSPRKTNGAASRARCTISSASS